MAKHMAEPEQQLNWAGEISGIIAEVLPAAEVVTRTVAEATQLIEKLKTQN
jgi:hypothetical protein